MAAKLNLWSLTLLPGEKYPLYVRRDFVVTNAALGEELRSNDGRSVVKVTHHPIPPHMFDSDSDSEFDSDDDEELDEEDDEDAESQYELDVEEGFKLTPKKDKVNGDAIEEDDAEEDDDEEDEDEDDDFSDDEVEETSVLCSLTAGRIEQATLDLTFVEGDAVMFEVTGENAVHLMGNYVIQPNPHSHDDDDSDYDFEDFDDEHDDYSELYGDLESDDEETGKITEISDLIKEKPKAAAKKVEAAPVESKKRKADAVESPAPKAAATAAADADALSKNQKKKLAKKAKTEEAAPVAAAKPAAAKAAAPQEKKGGKKTLPSGLVIEDVKVGDGPVARTGKRLGMRYIGKLENGKQFDANTAGKPFSFVLGKGEVIRGWDEGLAGMAVGGERRLTIPAGLAYGSQKLPGIPKNSTLKFDVKLVSVN